MAEEELTQAEILSTNVSPISLLRIVVDSYVGVREHDNETDEMAAWPPYLPQNGATHKRGGGYRSYPFLLSPECVRWSSR